MGDEAADDRRRPAALEGWSSCSSTLPRCSCCRAAGRCPCSPAPTCCKYLEVAARWVRQERRGRLGLRHSRHPRRPGSRSDQRRSGRADHAVDDVRTGRRRRAQGLRVLTVGEPNARRARDVRRVAGRARHGLAFASGLAAEDNVLRMLAPGDRILLGNDAYGGTFRLISKLFGPVGHPWTAVDLTDLDGLRTNWRDDTPSSGSRHRRTRCSRASTSRRSSTSPTSGARWSSSTTPSPRRTSSSRCRSAPTSSCTPPRSTSAATPTSSEGSSR